MTPVSELMSNHYLTCWPNCTRRNSPPVSPPQPRRSTRSGAVTARSEPRPPASGGGAVSVIAGSPIQTAGDEVGIVLVIIIVISVDDEVGIVLVIIIVIPVDGVSVTQIMKVRVLAEDIGDGFREIAQRDRQVIRSDLAEILRPWLDTKTPNERIFGDLPEATARMLRADLVAARSTWINAASDRAERERREESDFLRYRDREGRVVDFHSTRHTFISGIVAGNASIKVAQELARHSTSRLTVDRYSHTTTREVVDALDALPATKTEKIVPNNSQPGAQRQAQRAGRETPLLPATECDQPQCATKNANDPKSKESLALDALLPSKTALEQERRRRDSNPGWRICNPLPCPLNPEENGPLEKRLAQRLAPETGNGTITDELASVIDAWHTLPPDTRTAILAIVEAAQGR